MPQADKRVDDGRRQVLAPHDGARMGGPLRAGNGDQRVVIKALRRNQEGGGNGNRLAGDEEGNRRRHVWMLGKRCNGFPLGLFGGSVEKRHEKLGKLPKVRF